MKTAEKDSLISQLKFKQDNIEDLTSSNLSLQMKLN